MAVLEAKADCRFGGKMPVRRVAVSAKTVVHTKCVTIWMRPRSHRILRVMAAHRDSTIQDVIEGLILAEAARDRVIAPVVAAKDRESGAGPR